jgi:hypothetical protein
MRVRKVLSILVAAALLSGAAVAPASAAGLGSPPRSTVIPTPQNDPFYVPPAGYQSLANGTVIRSRPIVATSLTLPVPVASWQVLYKTLDSKGQPSATVATILVPFTPWTGPGPRPLVSYQTAEDSVGDQCAPSYALRSSFGGITSSSDLESPLFVSLLARNWAVVTSDYEGPQAQLLAGPGAGYAVLDGIRAARSFPDAGLASSPVALWGYSGGAFASAWASALRGTHAPELGFTAIALGGIPANLETTVRNVDGGFGAGLVIGGVIGLKRAYPEAGIDNMFSWLGKPFISAGGDDCTVGLIFRYAFKPLNWFTTMSKPFDDPRLKNVLTANSVTGKGGPPVAPVYSYHGTLDEIVPVAVADALVATYCAAGVPVQKVRTPIGEHNLLFISGAVGAQQFLADRFAGVPAQNNC